MRSTGFIFFSVLIHGLAVLAITMSPRQIADTAIEPLPVEITAAAEGMTGETEGSGLQASANLAPAPTAAPIPEVRPEPKTPEPKVAVSPPSRKVVSKIPKAVPKAANAESNAEPEQLDPELDESEEVADSPSAPAETPKAKPNIIAEDIKEQQSPAPAPTAANAGNGVATGTGDGGTLGHGGASQSGAVAFTELKQMKGNKPPSFPLSARKEKREGEVELLYKVTKDGQVADVTLAKSSGYEDLDEEAIKAVSRFRFVPGQEGWAKHPVRFSLKGDAEALPSRLRTTKAD